MNPALADMVDMLAEIVAAEMLNELEAAPPDVQQVVEEPPR